MGLAFALYLVSTGTWGGGASWERDVLRWYNAHPLPGWADSFMLAMPYVGTNLTILPIIIVAGLVLWRKYDQGIVAVHLFIVSIGSLSLNPTMKYLTARPRPDLFPLRGMWTWASYPSGHVILTPALYFTLALMLYYRYRWRWPFAAAAAIVILTGWSRLYLSVHWPTDLVGGVLIGVTWLVGSWRAFARYHAAR